MEALHSRRTYDYRIQEAICETGDRDLFPELNIPNSTIRSWLHRGVSDVVTSKLVGSDHSELLAENRKLENGRHLAFPDITASARRRKVAISRIYGSSSAMPFAMPSRRATSTSVSSATTSPWTSTPWQARCPAWGRRTASPACWKFAPWSQRRPRCSPTPDRRQPPRRHRRYPQPEAPQGR